jgi:hypothetical protein
MHLIADRVAFEPLVIPAFSEKLLIYIEKLKKWLANGGGCGKIWTKLHPAIRLMVSI